MRSRPNVVTSDTCKHFRQMIMCCGAVLLLAMLPALAFAQETFSTGAEAGDPGTKVAERVAVTPVSSDPAIDRRLTRILEATGWFTELDVQVREGVVFIDARTDSADHQAWAGELAGKTSDVVAVVNRIRVSEGSPWNLSPAVDEIQMLWKRTAQRLPRLGLGVLVMMLAVLAAWFAASVATRALEGRLKPLLRDVAARVLSILVFLVGFYLVLQVAGLSGLAATVLGGTGLAGLVAGFAFRDILENYLASILISTRNPFRIGDTVEIASYTGIVLRVTTRGTVLMDLDGNHVQIPNATVYKSIIRNFTANPNRRECFEVGIGFDNELAFAQEIALDVLNRHPAVLADPEALVLVDRLGSATVNLKVYFWYDGKAFNGPRIKSSLIRQVKGVFEARGISMPDEDREIIFPEGVPVRMLESEPVPRQDALPTAKLRQAADAGPSEQVTSDAEGSLASEDRKLREQARNSRVPEAGGDLLEGGVGMMDAPDATDGSGRPGARKADS